MSYVYEVRFEGSLELDSDRPLSQEEIEDEAMDVIRGDSYTWLTAHADVDTFEVMDCTEEEE